MKNPRNLIAALWAASGALLLGLLFARLVYPELAWLAILLAVLLLAALVGLVQLNRVDLRSRTVAYGLNSLVTILLVLGIVGVINFLANRHPQKLDLTKD